MGVSLAPKVVHCRKRGGILSRKIKTVVITKMTDHVLTGQKLKNATRFRF